MLEEVLVQGMRNLQTADEWSAETSSPQFGSLASWLWKKLTYDLRLSLCHLDGEEVIVVLLGLLAKDVLSEKRLGYLLEIVERAMWHRVEPI